MGNLTTTLYWPGYNKSNPIMNILCVLSENQKIFMIGFDLLYPGQYKVVVKFSNNQVTNSPFKFQVSFKVEMKDFKTVFTEIDKHEVESVLVKQVKDQLRTKLEDQTSTAIHHPPYVIQLLL